MSYVFNPEAVTSVPVVGRAERFPVRRVYCVGRNYEEHAKEMGFTGREPPFFFMKPADAVLPVAQGETGHLPYPTLTQDLHHEIELVVAIGQGGSNIAAQDALPEQGSRFNRQLVERQVRHTLANGKLEIAQCTLDALPRHSRDKICAVVIEPGCTYT